MPTLPPLRVLITRPAEQAEAWAGPLREAGALPVVFPTIEVQPPPSWQPLDEALAVLATYDWVVFTSAAAVRHSLGRRAGGPWPEGLKVAAVGEETARALASAGVPVHVVPKDPRGVSLAAALSALSAGARVLFPQALGGRVELREALLSQGCVVHVVPASQTLPVSPLPPVPAFDVATFASPSALRAFAAGAGIEGLRERPVVVLGATTAATATAMGLRPLVCTTPNVAGILSALQQGAASLPSI